MSYMELTTKSIEQVGQRGEYKYLFRTLTGKGTILYRCPADRGSFIPPSTDVAVHMADGTIHWKYSLRASIGEIHRFNDADEANAWCCLKMEDGSIKGAMPVPEAFREPAMQVKSDLNFCSI